MAIPVCVLIGLIISGCTKLNAVILGQPVSIPPLLLVAIIVILALAIGLLWILRALIRDGLQLRPAWTGGTG
jgi:hypothetical protein